MGQWLVEQGISLRRARPWDAATAQGLPAQAAQAGEQARQGAMKIKPVVQAFGIALAEVFARQARAYSANSVASTIS